jgi:hypothetical protein
VKQNNFLPQQINFNEKINKSMCHNVYGCLFSYKMHRLSKRESWLFSTYHWVKGMYIQNMELICKSWKPNEEK